MKALQKTDRVISLSDQAELKTIVGQQLILVRADLLSLLMQSAVILERTNLWHRCLSRLAVPLCAMYSSVEKDKLGHGGDDG